MIDNLVNKDFLPILLLGLLGGIVLIQLLYYYLFFNRLGGKNKPGEASDPGRKFSPVSVVICAHNEFERLTENLPLILEQDYPQYEVLVVNHSSGDDTEYLLKNLQTTYSHLKVVTIMEDLNFFTGKKFPLSIGIKSAAYDLILLTDADCKPASPQWIRLMQQSFIPGKDIVLGYSPYQRYKGLLNRLVRFDTLHVAMQYLSFAERGFPYMGVGRNLAYRKQLFYRNQGFISHYRIQSGDDDLFINRVAGRKNTKIMIHPGSHVVSEPVKTLKSWSRQKRRHLSTGLHYRFKHRMLLGAYSGSTFGFLLLSALLLGLKWSVIPVLFMILVRITSQYIAFSRCSGRLKERDLLPFVPVFELILIFMNISLAMANLFKKPVRWK